MKPKNYNDIKNSVLATQQLQLRTGVARTYQLLKGAGLSPCLTPNVLLAALKICEPAESRDALQRQAETGLRSHLVLLPRGLEELPACWLKGLPGIWRDLCRQNPRWHGTVMGALGFENGVLRLASALEQVMPLERVSLFDLQRIEINRRLYPSIWRPLKKAHERQIWQQYLPLRRELFHVPQWENGRPNSANAAAESEPEIPF